ncbi:MAG TPA: ABC transporter substrate-binding protein [Anaerovoracaceae bacterium]|nr:ABC transporter substrate-binding protein [Anaerovoracaceae bacterium]
MKRKIAFFLMLLLCLGMTLGCGTAEQNEPDEPDVADMTTFHIASLKGPTTMGMVKLMKDAEEDNVKHDYKFEIFGTADEIVPKLINGDLDVALLPCNLASVLYNKTEGDVQVAAINTLSVLYVIESGETVNSVQDLMGKTVYSTGKGTTPEFAFNYILKQNGIDPEKDLNIEYKSESTEIAAMLQDAEDTIAVLPQPYVSVVQMQNDKVRVALSFNEEWDKVGAESSMVTGVVLVRKAFAEENIDALNEFLDEYKASTEFVNANVEEAAQWIADYGIVAKAPIAVKALPDSSIVYIDGDHMKAKVSGYLKVLFDANPQAVGGALPEDDFYFSR